MLSFRNHRWLCIPGRTGHEERGKAQATDLHLTARWGYAGPGDVRGGTRGEGFVDVHLINTTRWQAVPAAVWAYTLGGYQVLKKWLSYSEAALLGPLTTDEAPGRVCQWWNARSERVALQSGGAGIPCGEDGGLAPEPRSKRARSARSTIALGIYKHALAFTRHVRRVAALLALHPALDAHYRACAP